MFRGSHIGHAWLFILVKSRVHIWSTDLSIYGPIFVDLLNRPEDDYYSYRTIPIGALWQPIFPAQEFP